MLSLSCDSSMSLWMTHLLSYLPTDLCKIEQCLYKLVPYEHVEDMQNTRNLLLQWVRCSDGAAAQTADGGICGEEGESSGMKIIQETKLSGLSQQGFLPI